MHTDPIYVIGAGGHAKVVIDALLRSGVASSRIQVSDGNPAMLGKHVLGFPVQVPAVRPQMRGGWFHVAIGNGRVRAQLTAQLVEAGARPLTVMHPSAVLAPSAAIGEAVFIAANAVVGPDARLDKGAIVNHGAVVDHDAVVGAYSHVAPNATLAGNARVGAQVLVGAGANLLPGIVVGEDAVIGAGAVVIKNIPAGRTCVGIPATSKTKD